MRCTNPGDSGRLRQNTGRFRPASVAIHPFAAITHYDGTMNVASAPLNLPETAPPVPWRTALWSILGFWGFYFVLNTFRMAWIYDFDHQLNMVVRRTAVVTADVGLTLVLCWFLRRLGSRPITVLVAAAFAASVPVALIHGAINHTAFYVVSPMQSVLRVDDNVVEKLTSDRGPLMMILDTATSWYFFIASWAFLYIALTYANKVRNAERTAAAYRSEAQSAQLRALRYQVNPHFLFNTLNSLSTLVLRDRRDEADRMIVNLSTFFRTSLTTDPSADVPLADELELQRLYLDVEQVRFPERLAVRIDVPNELAQVRVPSMILQPIIENAIKYGVAGTTNPVTVSISATARDGMLVLKVEDDAPPAANANAGTGAGVGLSNVAQRLQTRFGGRASMHHGRRAGNGYFVEVSIPLDGHA